MSKQVLVPKYFVPRPAQKAAWARRQSGDYDYYFKIWHRQYGKDTDDIQYSLYDSYCFDGIQSAYVGPDNKWIRRNIWDKYLDGRRHWADYPDDIIDPKDTQQQVRMLNNSGDKAPSLTQFIGFKESASLIGSSYDRFYFSELSLYKPGSLDYIQPIWYNKIANGEKLLVNFNFTPRGLSNIAADMLRVYTGKDDPKDWPGAHGRTYVDVVRADESLKADGTRLYTDEMLEQMRQQSIRQHGNDNMFRQEFLCDFLAVNAGLVYPAIEPLRKEGRFAAFNIDKRYPLYMAMDISSKGKESDWTSAIIFQYYEGRLWIHDVYEDNRKAVVECVHEIARKPYFHMIHSAFLPWDSDRSGSVHSPLEECRKAFGNIDWHKLERAYEADGINRVRMLMANMMIHNPNAAWLVECLENWEYKFSEVVQDFAAKPKHDRYSHTGDALRYVAEAIQQFPFLKSHTGKREPMLDHYPSAQYDLDEEVGWDSMPPGMRPSVASPLRKKNPAEVWDFNQDKGLWMPKQ